MNEKIEEVRFYTGPLAYRCQYVNFKHECKFHLNVFGDYQHCWSPYLHCKWCDNRGQCGCCVRCRTHSNQFASRNCPYCCPKNHFFNEMFLNDPSFCVAPLGSKIHESAEQYLFNEHFEQCVRKSKRRLSN